MGNTFSSNNDSTTPKAQVLVTPKVQPVTNAFLKPRYAKFRDTSLDGVSFCRKVINLILTKSRSSIVIAS